ncbi:MAG: carboxypeptidase regulatory-like domain-containing protein [Candidatus Bathyarchaeia archaeon]
MLKKVCALVMLAFLVCIVFQSVVNVRLGFATEAEPAKLKVYVAPPNVPADNKVYEAIFVQLLDDKGTPTRAKKDIKVGLSSSNIYVGSVEPEITIRAGETYAVAKFNSTFTPGTTTITASASGFATEQATVTTVGPVPFKLEVYCLPDVLPADGGSYPAIIVQLQDSSGTPAKAPIGGVRVTLSSSNSIIGNVEPHIHIEGGSTYSVAIFNTSLTEGSTVITAMASGYVSKEVTIKTQNPTSETPTKLKVCVGPPKVSAEGLTYKAVAVQLLDAKGKIAKANKNVTIYLSSSDTAVGTISETVVITNGETYALADFKSTYRSGSTTITAAANDLESNKGTISTVGPIPSKLAVYCAPFSLPADNNRYAAIIVQLQDSAGNPAKDPEGDVHVNLFSSKPDVGTVDSKVIIPYGETYSVASFYSTPVAGSTEITAQTAGYTSAKAKITTYLIDVYVLSVHMEASAEEVNAEENVTIRMYVAYNDTVPAPGTTIRLSSSKGGRFSPIIDEKNGYYTATFTAPKVTSHTVVTIIANASKIGYVSGIGNLEIKVNPVFRTGNVSIHVTDENGLPIRGANVRSVSEPVGMSPLNAFTDENGFASFIDIYEGEYVFEILKDGYDAQTVSARVTANKTITVTVHLRKSSMFALNTMLIVTIVVCVVIAVIVIVVFIKRRRPKEYSGLDMLTPMR